MSEKRFRQFAVWVADDEQDRYLSVEQVVCILNEQQELLNKRERQLRMALSFLASDVCSLSEAKLRELIKEFDEL